MEEEYRKVQLVGRRTHTISLPNNWVLKNNIKKNSFLRIIERGNDLIITKKFLKKEEIKEIFVNNLIY
ncbi:MAG: hypothetical protein QW103_01240 [Candidatus Pacearchaeota archaeon]